MIAERCLTRSVSVVVRVMKQGSSSWLMEFYSRKYKTYAPSSFFPVTCNRTIFSKKVLLVLSSYFRSPEIYIFTLFWALKRLEWVLQCSKALLLYVINYILHGLVWFTRHWSCTGKWTNWFLDHRIGFGYIQGSMVVALLLLLLLYTFMIAHIN